jgi:hypothetical protein
MALKYCKQFLDDALLKDNATIIGEYDVLKRDTIIKFKCNCGEEGSKNFRALAEKSGAYCKKCIDIKSKIKTKNTFLTNYGVDHPMKTEGTKNKQKEVMLEKYGVENPFQNKEVKEKIKKSMIQKYGVEHPLQSNELQNKKTITNLERFGVKHAAQNKNIIKKMKETTLERYGVENCMLLDENKNKLKATNLERYGVEHAAQNKEVMSKMKATHLERHGVEHPMLLEENKNKIIKTNIEKYGVKSPLQNKNIMNKMKLTNINRYGSECVLQNKEIQNKIKATNIEVYGVENPMQNIDVMDKCQRNLRKHKKYVFPSGNIRHIQGYEHFALNDLLKIYTENEIKTNRREIPRIKYVNNDKDKYYFPDIYIPHINKIIEVKSTWTYECDIEIIKLKKTATELLGYDYEIWIYDSKGIKVKIIECNKELS